MGPLIEYLLPVLCTAIRSESIIPFRRYRKIRSFLLPFIIALLFSTVLFYMWSTFFIASSFDASTVSSLINIMRLGNTLVQGRCSAVLSRYTQHLRLSCLFLAKVDKKSNCVLQSVVLCYWFRAFVTPPPSTNALSNSSESRVSDPCAGSSGCLRMTLINFNQSSEGVKVCVHSFNKVQYSCQRMHSLSTSLTSLLPLASFALKVHAC